MQQFKLFIILFNKDKPRSNFISSRTLTAGEKQVKPLRFNSDGPTLMKFFCFFFPLILHLFPQSAIVHQTYPRVCSQL